MLKSPKIPILLTKKFHTIILLKIRTQRIEERIVFDERQKYDSNSLINPNLNEKLIVQPKTNVIVSVSFSFSCFFIYLRELGFECPKGEVSLCFSFVFLVLAIFSGFKTVKNYLIPIKYIG